MKNILLLILLFGCNTSSNNQEAFKKTKEIDFTFDSGWKDMFSMKINSHGECVIGDGRWSVKYSKGQLSKLNLNTLDSMIESIPFSKYDSSYYEDIVDQSSYKIVIIDKNNDTTVKFVYGKVGPQLLNDLSNQLRTIKENIKAIKTDTIIDFISRRNFSPPAIKS